MFKKFQALGKVISSVKPNVPKTQIEKKIRDLKIETQKLKGSGKKLDQTVFEIQNKKPITFKKDKSKTLSNSQKARKGLKFGGGADMGKKKSNIQKIKEAFGAKSKNKNLKPVDKKKNPGLAKLPIEVRNKMGYAKKGGRA